MTAERLITPAVEDLVKGFADLVPGVLARHAGHQEFVVRGVVVADGGDHCEDDRVLIEGAAGSRAADSTAAAGAGVLGDCLGASRWAVREEAADFLRHPLLEVDVLVGSPLAGTFPLACSDVRVGQALFLGEFQRGLLDEHPLPFVPLPGAAPADHDRG